VDWLRSLGRLPIRPNASAAHAGAEIVLIILLAYFALRLISRAVARFERHLG
jgi:hypothetical protein